MFVLRILSMLGLLLYGSPLHGPPQAPPPPVPHWVVLLVVVPILWLVIGGTVLMIDWLLRQF